MIFPLWIFLAIYGLFFFICSFFVFFNFYHMARFGLQSTKTTIVLALYTIAFAAVVLLQVNLILSIDWTQTLSISEAFFSTAPTF
ncbi:hypothetical protein HON52_00525 [Candidatus Uhrbacteria bacterium]|jgi:hypothetical protein|nr:hypothetical protein [Candidatus Uhrbacteria bacterium]